MNAQSQWSYSTGSQSSWSSQSPAPIPEPASGLLIAAGLLIVAWAIRRRLKG